MSTTLYNIYVFIFKIKKRLNRKISPSGKIFIVFTLLSILFGFNTKQTMIYQLAALNVAILSISFPFSFFFAPTIRVKRNLPKTCIAGEKLTYLLQVENISEKTSAGIFFKEQLNVDPPSFANFAFSYDSVQENRNFIDRKLRFYHWRKLLQENCRASFTTRPLPQLLPHDHTQVEISFQPIRRGYIQLEGFSIHRYDPLGIFKKEHYVNAPHKLLVLPELYPVINTNLSGTRKYHQGGSFLSTSFGESGEFVYLRDYRHGDPVKHIDWKVTARTTNPQVRQYQDKYFSRYGVLLDTFTEQNGVVLENAISVAASIIAQQDTTTNFIELLFACDNCTPILSTGRGVSDKHHMLEILSCIRNCDGSDFSSLSELVKNHSKLLSGLILVLLKLDDQRIDLLEYLESIKIPHKAFIITDNKKKFLSQLTNMTLGNIRVFDVKNESKMVDLT